MEKNYFVHRTTGLLVNFKILTQEVGLSLKAIGLYVRIVALANLPDWEFSVNGLAAISQEGREAIQGGIAELEAAGLLRREQGRQGGAFSGSVWHIYEEPVTGPPMTGFPPTVQPSTVQPSTDNPPQRREVKKEGKEEKKESNKSGAIKIPAALQPIKEQIQQLLSEKYRKGAKSRQAWVSQIAHLEKAVETCGIQFVEKYLSNYFFKVDQGGKVYHAINGDWIIDSFKNNPIERVKKAAQLPTVKETEPTADGVVGLNKDQQARYEAFKQKKTRKQLALVPGEEIEW